MVFLKLILSNSTTASRSNDTKHNQHDEPFVLPSVYQRCGAPSKPPLPASPSPSPSPSSFPTTSAREHFITTFQTLLPRELRDEVYTHLLRDLNATSLTYSLLPATSLAAYELAQLFYSNPHHTFRIHDDFYFGRGTLDDYTGHDEVFRTGVVPSEWVKRIVVDGGRFSWVGYEYGGNGRGRGEGREKGREKGRYVQDGEWYLSIIFRERVAEMRELVLKRGEGKGMEIWIRVEVRGNDERVEEDVERLVRVVTGWAWKEARGQSANDHGVDVRVVRDREAERRDLQSRIDAGRAMPRHCCCYIVSR